MARSRAEDDRGPRAELVQRATGALIERGLSDLSLRELATLTGTSHRMLIYHFGSRNALLMEVAREVERRQRAVLADLLEGFDGSLADLARCFWRSLCAPTLAPLERLFFELYGQDLQGKLADGAFLAGVVDNWIEPMVPVLMAEGLTEADARAEARLGLAVVRGLLLDLLATGDRVEVDCAFERHLAAVSALRQPHMLPKGPVQQGADKPGTPSTSVAEPFATGNDLTGD
ncbi:MAG: TetR/AcrR family transcriptional regulator [Mycobacteriales bacterium]